MNRSILQRVSRLEARQRGEQPLTVMIDGQTVKMSLDEVFDMVRGEAAGKLGARIISGGGGKLSELLDGLLYDETAVKLYEND